MPLYRSIKDLSKSQVKTLYTKNEMSIQFKMTVYAQITFSKEISLL